MSKHRYKIEFEIVNPISHPEHYYGDRPITPPGEVPAEHWQKVSREADTLEQLAAQYRNLKKWEIDGKELTRNAKLYEITLPHWQEIDERVLDS